MSLRAQYEQLLREIDALPPHNQIERLLKFFADFGKTLSADELEVLRVLFATRGTPEAEAFAEVIEGEQALRKLALPDANT